MFLQLLIYGKAKVSLMKSEIHGQSPLKNTAEPNFACMTVPLTITQPIGVFGRCVAVTFAPSNTRLAFKR